MKIQSVNDWRDEVSKLLSDLSDKLLSAKSLAIENDSSHCLVELESALMLVDQLKSMIATKRAVS